MWVHLFVEILNVLFHFGHVFFLHLYFFEHCNLCNLGLTLSSYLIFCHTVYFKRGSSTFTNIDAPLKINVNL